MDWKQTYTWQEIQSQPEAWSAALKKLHEYSLDPASSKPEGGDVIFTGCGSTYYLALSAAAVTQGLTGLTCRALPASELWLNPQSAYPQGKTTLIAISRSGETTETLNACRAFLEDKRGNLLTFSCYADQPLAKMGRLNIVLDSAQERSVAQTRAFSTLFLGTLALAIHWSGREDLIPELAQLPEMGQKVLGKSAEVTEELGRDKNADRFYWLGSGSRYGLACEASLKMKEMSLTHSEPFHFLEFRHGPKSMVTPSARVIGLVSSANASREKTVLNEIKELGGKIKSVAERDAELAFESGLGEPIHDILFLPVAQSIAFHRSISKGLNPDLPTNLDPVVKLS
jgi:glucosamine--fructose-6-phosphate aminotransferase (isomerizing)